MKLTETLKFSSQVCAAYLASKTVRLIAGRALEDVVYLRVNARGVPAVDDSVVAVPAELSAGQKARVVVAASVYLSMRDHPIMWALAAGCACFWIVTAIKAVA